MCWLNEPCLMYFLLYINYCYPILITFIFTIVVNRPSQFGNLHFLLLLRWSVVLEPIIDWTLRSFDVFQIDDIVDHHIFFGFSGNVDPVAIVADADIKVFAQKRRCRCVEEGLAIELAVSFTHRLESINVWPKKIDVKLS